MAKVLATGLKWGPSKDGDARLDNLIPAGTPYEDIKPAAAKKYAKNHGLIEEVAEELSFDEEEEETSDAGEPEEEG